jgi:uncharacterized membrane protein
MGDRLAPLGRTFFAVGLIAFAVLQVVYGDFIPGRAPAWPATLPGRVIWIDAAAALFIACGLAMIANQRVREAGIVTAALIFVWAFLRNIPPALADHIYGGAWTNLGKGLALSGGALAVAGSVPPRRPAFLLLGRAGLGTFLMSSGIQHFLFVPFVATLVPSWIPGPVFWTYFAGVALIAGGLGMMVPPTVRWAALLSGVMIFLWVVMLHVPRALAAAADNGRNEWTGVFEALALSGIAFVLAGTAPPPSSK